MAASNTILKSLQYDSTWDWTPVSWTIAEHSTYETNSLRTCKTVDLAVSAYHRVKWKEKLKKRTST